MKLNLVNICLSIFLVFLMVFFLLLPHFRKSKIEALDSNKSTLMSGEQMSDAQMSGAAAVDPRIVNELLKAGLMPIHLLKRVIQASESDPDVLLLNEVKGKKNKEHELGLIYLANPQYL